VPPCRAAVPFSAAFAPRRAPVAGGSRRGRPGVGAGVFSFGYLYAIPVLFAVSLTTAVPREGSHSRTGHDRGQQAVNRDPFAQAKNAAAVGGMLFGRGLLVALRTVKQSIAAVLSIPADALPDRMKLCSHCTNRAAGEHVVM
jgi:hypothetical protein